MASLFTPFQKSYNIMVDDLLSFFYTFLVPKLSRQMMFFYAFLVPKFYLSALYLFLYCINLIVSRKCATGLTILISTSYVICVVFQPKLIFLFFSFFHFYMRLLFLTMPSHALRSLSLSYTKLFSLNFPPHNQSIFSLDLLSFFFFFPSSCS